MFPNYHSKRGPIVETEQSQATLPDSRPLESTRHPGAAAERARAVVAGDDVSAQPHLQNNHLSHSQDIRASRLRSAVRRRSVPLYSATEESPIRFRQSVGGDAVLTGGNRQPAGGSRGGGRRF